MDKTKEIIEKLKKITGKKPSQKFTFPILILMTFFLLLNIYFSQNISSVFLGVINGNKNQITTFLQKINKKDFFNQQLNYFENIFGKEIIDEVFAKEKAQKQTIEKLNKILEKNPNSRDVLYRLYQEYQALGDEKKAKEYLNKARLIDPELSN
ncbi:MAG: hypothetical protein Fur009_0150 [Candidatus Microgenomates bacterium]